MTPKKRGKKPPRAKRKTTTHTTVASNGIPVGELIPQPHGGALRNGGTNAGGPGRPKSEVRAAALAGADAAIPILRKIIEDTYNQTKKPAVVTAAADKLMKYGLGTQTEITVDDIKERLRRTLEVLRDELPVEILSRVLPRIRPIWT